MTATYTFDVFATVDGFGSASSEWSGYWGKQGPQLLQHRLELYANEVQMVFGANTYREFADMLAKSSEYPDVRDPWVTEMRKKPVTIISSTLKAPVDWPRAKIARGDGAEIVANLKAQSEVPLRSIGSLSLNRSLMNAGLVDFVQLTVFPVITGQTGKRPIFEDAADFDLELVDARLLDRNIEELTYRPSLHD